MKKYHVLLLNLIITSGLIAQPKPTLVGKDVISRGAIEFNTTMTEDESTLFFTVGNPMWSILNLCYSEKIDNKWSTPKLLPFSGEYLDADPFLFENKRLFFISERPIDDKVAYQKWDYNIWYSDYKNNEWSDPEYLDGEFNDLGMILYPSLSVNNNLYFTARENGNSGIYVSKWNNKYGLPEKLAFVKDDINYLDAIISKNEDYIIFTSNMEGGFGGSDLWICFKKDQSWSDPINLGENINSPGNDGQPGLSPDEKTLFYSYGGSQSEASKIDTYQSLYKNLFSAQNGF